MAPNTQADFLLAFLAEQVGARNTSQRDVCREVGWPVDTLTQLFLGRRSFLVEHFLGIAQWLGIPPEELLLRFEARQRAGAAPQASEEPEAPADDDDPARAARRALVELRALLRQAVEHTGLPALVPEDLRRASAAAATVAAQVEAQEAMVRALLEQLIRAAGTTPTKLSLALGRSRTYLFNVVLRRDGRRARLRLDILIETLQALGWTPAAFFATLRRELGETPRWQAPVPRLDDPTPEALLSAAFDVVAEETGRRPRWGAEGER